jgi:hypothetical protein
MHVSSVHGDRRGQDEHNQEPQIAPPRAEPNAAARNMWIVADDTEDGDGKQKQKEDAAEYDLDLPANGRWEQHATSSKAALVGSVRAGTLG